MNKLSRRSIIASVVALSIAATTGCSSSSNAGGGASSYDGVTSAAFSAYCTATLTNPTELMKEVAGGAWEGDGTLEAPAGTPFLLAVNGAVWGGFVLQNDGTPFEVNADFTKGLVAGTDFTSSCAPATVPFTGAEVLLADAKLYPNADLSGTECTLDAGTTLTNYSYSSGGTASATISADQITATCNVTTMYASEFPLAELVAN